MSKLFEAKANQANISSFLLDVKPSEQALLIELITAYKHAHHRNLLKDPKNRDYLAQSKQPQLPDTYRVESLGETQIKITGSSVALDAVRERLAHLSQVYTIKEIVSDPPETPCP